MKGRMAMRPRVGRLGCHIATGPMQTRAYRRTPLRIAVDGRHTASPIYGAVRFSPVPLGPGTRQRRVEIIKKKVRKVPEVYIDDMASAPRIIPVMPQAIERMIWATPWPVRPFEAL
jgi:hypothetical protein